ncbi:MAG TPA: hypothetical protein VHN14_23805 [Kofleriaceae bacterium]|nr:hypothetical protein [Kofleriaceae bacterium]
MAELDVTFRRLLRDLPQPLMQLAFPQRAIESLGPLDPSVDRTRQLTTDNMVRAIEGSTEVVVHVEIERDWRPKLADRLFDYASAAVTATRLPVWSVVVLLRPGGRPPQGTGVCRVPGADGDAFVFRYQVVPLWQLDAREMQAQLGPAGAPFCAAMRGADEAFIRELVAEVQIHPGLAPRDRRSTIQLLYIVSAVILGSETARRIFHVESIIQDPNVQALIREWEDKGRAEGHAEGRTEGHAEGRTEGRAEEARSLLLKVLRARSLLVTSDVRARIDSEADLARLESWLEAAVTATELSDVFRDS